LSRSTWAVALVRPELQRWSHMGERYQWCWFPCTSDPNPNQKKRDTFWNSRGFGDQANHPDVLSGFSYKNTKLSGHWKRNSVMVVFFLP
jgi:hypothetical protein